MRPLLIAGTHTAVEAIAKDVDQSFAQVLDETDFVTFELDRSESQLVTALVYARLMKQKGSLITILLTDVPTTPRAVTLLAELAGEPAVSVYATWAAEVPPILSVLYEVLDADVALGHRTACTGSAGR